MEGIAETEALPQQAAAPIQVQHHEIPKCGGCGTVTQWKVEKLFLPRHVTIGLLLLVAGGSGVIYFAIIGLSRSGKNNRDKICPQCGTKNSWSFVY